MSGLRPFYIILIIAGIYLPACTPEGCLEETESYLKASFYSSATGVQVKPDSITVHGNGMEFMKIYSGQRQLSIARLPLNPSTGSSDFVVKINTGTDNLSVTYSSYVHLISKECGYSFNHVIEGISSSNNLIDSVRIINPQITNENLENIRIYF